VLGFQSIATQAFRKDRSGRVLSSLSELSGMGPRQIPRGPDAGGDHAKHDIGKHQT